MKHFIKEIYEIADVTKDYNEFYAVPSNETVYRVKMVCELENGSVRDLCCVWKKSQFENYKMQGWW